MALTGAGGGAVGTCNNNNNNTASVKLNVPIIKLDDGGDLEAMNGVATIACPNNEDQYLTYNHLDSGGGGGTKCICSSHETDADCSNIIGLSNCDLGHVNCGSGKKFQMCQQKLMEWKIYFLFLI